MTALIEGRDVLDRAVQDLLSGAARWTATPLDERIALLERLMPCVLVEADPMVAAASAAKGYPADSPWAGEDWANGPWAIHPPGPRADRRRRLPRDHLGPVAAQRVPGRGVDGIRDQPGADAGLRGR